MKYLKTYKQINEGLRDMMKSKDEDQVLKDLRKLPIDEWLNKASDYGLDKKYYPPDKEIIEYLKELPINEWFNKVRNSNLDYKFYPSDEEIKNGFKKIPIDDRLDIIFRFDLDLKFLPSDKEIVDNLDIFKIIDYINNGVLDKRLMPSDNEIKKYLKTVDIEDRLDFITFLELDDKFKSDDILNEGLRDKMKSKSDEEILDELMDNKEPHLILKKSLRYEFIKGIKIIIDNHDITDRNFKNVFVDYITYLSNPDHVKYLLDNGDVRNHFNNLQLYALEKFYFGKYDGKTTTIEDLLKEQMDKLSIEEDFGAITGSIRNSRIFIYGKEQKILISSKLNIVSTMSNHNFLEIENNYLALLLAVIVSEKFGLDIEKTININNI